MKKLVPIFLFCLASYVGVAQLEVKLSPHPTRSTHGTISLEYIKNDSIGYEIQWTRQTRRSQFIDFDTSLIRQISRQDFYFIQKKYKNAEHGADKFYTSPFIKLGFINDNPREDSTLDTVLAGLGYLLGYKQCFKSGLTIEPTLDLNLGVRYDLPNSNGFPTRTVDRFNGVFDPTFRFWIGYRFGDQDTVLNRTKNKLFRK